MNIGFIGLGHMGLPMCVNLLKTGHTIFAYDLNQNAIHSAVQQGAVAAHSALEVAKSADVIFTMLQSGQQVSTTCLGEEGIFQHAKKGLLYIDSSSIDITTTRELHKIADKLNIAMLDAPVSGGTVGAETGSLTFMVGGQEHHFQSAKPLLEKMGRKIIHAGDAGHGQAAKICNNLMLGICMIAACEGFSLGKKLGLDPKKLFEISANSSSQCWSITQYCPIPGLVEKAPSNNAYKPGFTAKMMLKDLRLAQHAAESINACIPLGAEAAELYSLFNAQGHSEMDFSGIITMLMS